MHQSHTVLHLKDKFTKFRNCSVFNRKKYHPIIETIKIPMCVYEKGDREGGREGLPHCCHLKS